MSGFREVKLLVQGHGVGSGELGWKPRLSDSCYATSSTAAARLTHTYKRDIYFRAILRITLRYCRGDLKHRNGKDFSRRSPEQRNIMRHQSTKPWMDYVAVIFYFRYLNIFPFLSLWGYVERRRRFAPIPKVSCERSQCEVRITENSVLQNCTCFPPPCGFPPHCQYCKEFGSTALSIFFSQKNVLPCVFCSF